jgi:hypothetical protein
MFLMLVVLPFLLLVGVCCAFRPTKQIPVQVGKVVNENGHLRMQTSNQYFHKKLPHLAMYVWDKGGWGFVRLTDLKQVEQLEELGIELVSSGNSHDQEYVSGTLPIYSWFDGFWDSQKRTTTREVPPEFLVVVELGNWWKE